jgi:hypothetical protein
MMYRMMGGPGANWDSMPDYMQNMMQKYWGGVGTFWGLAGLIDFITSILLMVLIIAAIRWLWKKGDKA